jgi:hypothetical protein
MKTRTKTKRRARTRTRTRMRTTERLPKALRGKLELPKAEAAH